MIVVQTAIKIRFVRASHVIGIERNATVNNSNTTIASVEIFGIAYRIQRIMIDQIDIKIHLNIGDRRVKVVVAR